MTFSLKVLILSYPVENFCPRFVPPAAQSNCSRFFITKVRSPEQKIKRPLFPPLPLSIPASAATAEAKWWNKTAADVEIDQSDFYSCPPPPFVIKRAKPKISQLKARMKWISTCNTHPAQPGRHSENCIDLASFLLSPLVRSGRLMDRIFRVCSVCNTTKCINSSMIPDSTS